MNAAPQISIVTPVYRNAATLADLVERLGAMLDRRGESWELICVDDACPAGSSMILSALAARDRRVRVLTHDHNRGQNLAVLTGLDAARGDVAVVMDADLQDSPEAVPRLLDALTGAFDAVFAGRRGVYESRVRLLTSRLHKRLLHAASGRRVPIDAGLFVAMTRRMVDRVLAFRERDPYVIALMARTGLSMTSVPVNREARPTGESAYTAADRVRLAVRALRSIRRGGGSG